MPIGVYKRKPFTDKHRNNLIKSHLGKKGSRGFLGKTHTKNAKIKIGKAAKGRTSWNKGKTGAKMPAWKDGRMSNKEYVKWLQNKRRRTKRFLNKSGSFHTFAEWDLLKAQYNWTCPCCKKSEPEIKLTADHIIPISKGGSDNIENIQPLCKSCNCKKYTKIIKY